MTARRLLRLCSATVLATVAAAPALAADFYAGKTLNFIVGTDVTGGFAIYGRLIAKHLPRFIPGSPTIVVRTMPGAGGSVAASYLFRQAPRDGTTIAALTPNAISGKLMEDSVQSQFDPTRFRYIAGAERGTRLCMSFHTSKIGTLEAAIKQKSIIGATSAGSPTMEYAAFHKHALGAPFEIVGGYRGPGDLFLAMERGEIDGVCGLDWTALKAQQPDWLRDKKLNLLVQDNIEPDPELKALGVPQPWPFINDPIDRQAVELMIGFQQAFGKAYVAPPEVPDAPMQVLRQAFAVALRDKDLLADAQTQRVEISPQSGEEVGRTVRDLYNAPRDVVERLKRIVSP